MKKGVVLIVLFALMLSLVTAAGCGYDSATAVSTSAGDVAVTDNSGSTQTVATSDKAPSQAELGAPTTRAPRMCRVPERAAKK